MIKKEKEKGELTQYAEAVFSLLDASENKEETAKKLIKSAPKVGEKPRVKKRKRKIYMRTIGTQERHAPSVEQRKANHTGSINLYNKYEQKEEKKL